MQIKQIKIAELKPYQNNAKKHPAKQIRQVADSIREFGFNQPIVTDKDNVIIVGHGRYEASKLLKLEKVPVLQVSIEESKAKAYRLADNKLNESDWDMSLVIDELKELSDEEVDLTGFDKDLEIEQDIEGEEDFATELLEANNYIVFAFDNEMDFMAVESAFGLEVVKIKRKNKKMRIRGIGRVVNGQKLLKLL